MKKETIETLPPVAHDNVTHLVGAYHVSEHPKKIIRAIARKMKPKPRGAQLRYLIAAVYNAHAKNIHLYKYVMGSVPRKYPKYLARYRWDETNQTVVILK